MPVINLINKRITHLYDRFCVFSFIFQLKMKKKIDLIYSGHDDECQQPGTPYSNKITLPKVTAIVKDLDKAQKMNNFNDFMER